MRTFTLYRSEDVSGVSGTGTVAEGVEFHDGQCVVSWFGKHHSIEVHPRIEDVEAIHGHGGKTKIVFDSLPVRNCTCNACELMRDAQEVPEDE